jgi:hypothetical protein
MHIINDKDYLQEKRMSENKALGIMFGLIGFGACVLASFKHDVDTAIDYAFPGGVLMCIGFLIAGKND